MEPAAKPSFAPGFISRLLLLGVFVLLFRFVYVVTSRGGSCASGDFCFSSTSAEFYSLPGGVSGGAAFVRVSDGSAISPELRHLWTSKNWRKAVEFYSSVFQDLIVEGFLSPTSKSLCVETISGHEVLALKEIGVADAVGIYKKKSPPLVVAGDILHQPFGDNSFDFVFVGRILDQIRRPADLAGEIARVLKPKGFLVLLTLSGGDLYSLHSLEVLFSCCKKVRSREINGQDSSKSLREIVFQKEVIQIIKDKAMQTNDDVDPLIGGNLLNKCSIPEHKLQLLRSAEPLIEEEPQKPWITLKKNIKNIKYLPSMVDMSFKQRYVYIDVGARSYGSSIGSWFKKQYPKQNKTFEIYAIEADRAFHGEYASKKGIKLLPFAAWVRNESISFEVNHDQDPKSDERGSGIGRTRAAGVSSNDLSSGHLHMIQGFDFAEWLKNTVTEKDFVVLKMDVEETEFDLDTRLGYPCHHDAHLLHLLLPRQQIRFIPIIPSSAVPFSYEVGFGTIIKIISSKFSELARVAPEMSPTASISSRRKYRCRGSDKPFISPAVFFLPCPSVRGAAFPNRPSPSSHQNRRPLYILLCSRQFL